MASNFYLDEIHTFLFKVDLQMEYVKTLNAKDIEQEVKKRLNAL